jgi:hypothetical protein
MGGNTPYFVLNFKSRDFRLFKPLWRKTNMKTQLLTCAAAARYLGICEQVARRILADHAVLVGTRKRYPLSVIERISATGAIIPRVHAAYSAVQTLRP